MASKGFLGEVGHIFSILGKDALKVVGIVVGNAKIINEVVGVADPALAPEVALIGSAVGAIWEDITAAEAAYAAAGKTQAGAAKMASVLPKVGDAVGTAVQTAGFAVIDQAKYDAALQGFSQNWVDLLASIQAKPAPTPAPAATKAPAPAPAKTS